MEKYIVVACSGTVRIAVGGVFDVVKSSDNDTIRLRNVDGSDTDDHWLGTISDEGKLLIEGVSFRADLEPLTFEKERELEIKALRKKLACVKEHDSCEALVGGEIIDCYFFANKLNCDDFDCIGGYCYITKEEAEGYEEGND